MAIAASLRGSMGHVPAGGDDAAIAIVPNPPRAAEATTAAAKCQGKFRRRRQKPSGAIKQEA